MARQRKKTENFAALIERSDRARATLAEAKAELTDKLDIAGRMKEAVTSQPAKLVAGGVAAAYFAKKIFFRRKASPRSREISHLKTERGFLLGLIALFGALAKPLAKMYATKLLKDYLGHRFRAGALNTRTAMTRSRSH